VTAVRIGVMLPTFSDDAEHILVAARAAATGGLDGVFAFDHLWPIGRPGRPALWSFAALAAAAAATERVCVGPLVARVGLLADDDLMDAFHALIAIAGRPRVIAALGTGDHESAPENHAYGVPYPHAAERLAAVARVASRLRDEGVATWVGGLSAQTAQVARAVGAARNLWGVDLATIKEAAQAGEGQVPQVSWAGQVLVGRDRTELEELRDRFGDRPGLVAGTVDEVAAQLGAFGAAGASWCVCAPLDYLARPREAVETICLVRRAVP